MNKVNPYKRINRPEYVFHELERIILSDDYSENDKLPSQNELAEQFNVGIRTIREVIKQLEIKGLVSIEQGRDVFVKRKDLDFFLSSLVKTFQYKLPQNSKVLFDLTDTRELIECSAIRSFFTRSKKSSQEILEKLKQILEQMAECKEKSDLKEYHRLDIKFHQTLVAAMKNRVVDYLYKNLSDLILFSIDETEKEKKYNFRGFQEHKQLLNALHDGKREVADHIIKNHLAYTREIIHDKIMTNNKPLASTV